MEFYGSFSVKSKLPERINNLEDLAYNLWWSWNYKAEELFKRIDRQLWQEYNNNPVELIYNISQSKLEALATDKEFLQQYDEVISDFEAYLATDDTWFQHNFPDYCTNSQEVIAYFSAEFGLHESLPIYSGGLGVLSGDHCKSASDLGLPFVGVGLLYRSGYFKQQINEEGWQEAFYPTLDLSYLPVTPAQDDTGNDLKVQVKLANREVIVKVWKLQIGRVKLFSLDTDLPANNATDRQLTSRLYSEEQETRISQEIILGIGGTKALVALGYNPVVWHLNEGHSVYLEFARIKELMKQANLEFNEAMEVVAANSVFTTHTPVPAGNEVFPFGLKEKYFANYWGEFDLTKDEFMNLGCVHDVEQEEGFCLTVLALKLARYNNGVSQLHGEVASDMWEEIWGGVPTEENPITAITNGIHTLTWLAPEWEELFDEYLPADWRQQITDQQMWEQIRQIPAAEFWQVHYQLKSKLIDYVRDKDLARRKRYGNLASKDEGLLDKDKLTIGFARRFATYKRATLVFNDLKRLSNICNQSDREVQFIFAGKAHPADVPGQELIKKIYDISQQEEFKGQIVILEDYDLEMARYLVQGVDVWLNNPRRPLEASGTSGQKVAANGGLNCSVLDGWWCEGYNGKNGWVIGREITYDDQAKQDEIDSNSLYYILEKEIIPLYYDVERGVATNWITRMKEAMITSIPVYSTDRMVQEYTTELYLPAYNRGTELKANQYQKAKQLVAWKEKLTSAWSEIELKAGDQKIDNEVYKLEEKIEFSVQVELATLRPADIEVELYLLSEANKETEVFTMELKQELAPDRFIYNLSVDLSQLKYNGDYKYTFRVVPESSKLTDKHELGLVTWL